MKSIQTNNFQRKTKITSTVFKSNQQDRKIGSNFILTALLKNSRIESLVFTRVFFEKMFLVKLINNSQYFMFQLVIHNIQAKCNICFTLPMLCFKKNVSSCFCSSLAYVFVYCGEYVAAGDILRQIKS